MQHYKIRERCSHSAMNNTVRYGLNVASFGDCTCARTQFVNAVDVKTRIMTLETLI